MPLSIAFMGCNMSMYHWPMMHVFIKENTVCTDDLYSWYKWYLPVHEPSSVISWSCPDYELFIRYSKSICGYLLLFYITSFNFIWNVVITWNVVSAFSLNKYKMITKVFFLFFFLVKPTVNLHFVRTDSCDFKTNKPNYFSLSLPVPPLVFSSRTEPR